MTLFRHLRRAHRHWRRDDGNLLAAAVAYYAALSFFPLLLILISGLGFVLKLTEWGNDAESQVLSTIGEYASPAVFEHAFDRIWNVDRRPLESILEAVGRIVFFRLRAFLMLISILGLTLIVFFAGVVISTVKARTQGLLPAAEWVWWVVESGSSLVLNCGLFTLIYRLLPKVPVRWSEAARGALFAALTWELGRLALTLLLVGQKYSAYGVVGSFIAVMLWIYFASSVVFMGAEYVQVLCEDRQPKATTIAGGEARADGRRDQP